MMPTPKTTISARLTSPKPDTIAAYIGFVGRELCLFEANLHNQIIRRFALDESDPGIPACKLKEAREMKGTALSQVNIFIQKGYVAYHHVTRNLKCKKQGFWVKQPDHVLAA